ncbi:MAG TPA: TolC family protein [Planctomycetaceae bacterium]|nr:TolC family protein [Planctomycetaceae bacterium]
MRMWLTNLILILLLTAAPVAVARAQEPGRAAISRQSGAVRQAAAIRRSRQPVEPASALSTDAPRRFRSTLRAQEPEDPTSILVPQAAPVVEPVPLTLAELTRLAEENHPVLRRDSARIVASEGEKLQAGLYPNPEFNTNNPEVFSGRNSSFNAGIMQEIVVKGKLRLNRAAATQGVRQTQFAYVQDRFSLFTAVRSQFYTTLAAQRRVEILTKLSTITAASVKTAEQRVEAGIGERTEVLLLTIDYERVQADLQNAQRILIGEREQLSAIVGMPGLVNGKVVGALTAAPPEFDEEILQQFVTTENALVRIAAIDVEKQRILLQRAEAEPYPNITVGPSYNWGVAPGQDQFWLTFTFPIPSSNRNQGNIKAARANIHQSVEDLGTVQLELLRRVADALSRHRGARIQAERYRTKIIPDSVEALRLAKSGFDRGVFDFAAYLQAQRTVVETNIAYVGLLETVWTTAAELAGLLQLEHFP